MALSKYKLGELIQLSEEVNEDNNFDISDVRGVSIKKEFIETKADMEGVSLRPYLIVKPGYFAYVTITSRNGDKISFAYNTSKDTYLVSSSYVVFYVMKRELLLPEYLNIFFNRPEFDRYSRFNSWGSAREAFSWEEMCDIDIELPPIEVQQKYVDIYQGMVNNQKAYERGLEDLKLVCDGYIEDLRRRFPSEPIGKYIRRYSEKNTGKQINKVVGLSTKKEFREAQSRVKRDELAGYKILHPLDIAFVPTTDTWKGLAFAVNHFSHDVVVSPIYEVFTADRNVILSDYLAMWLKRDEFDRYARYNSWGSARENFSFDDMCQVKIPIPDIEAQKSIADIFHVYNTRKRINEQLKAQIKDICPILIKGSIDEAR